MTRFPFLLSLLLALPLRAADVRKGVDLPSNAAGAVTRAAGAALPGAGLVSPLPSASIPSAAALPPSAVPAASAAQPAAQPAAQAAQAAQPAAIEQVRAIHARLEAQLKDMEEHLGGTDPIIEKVRSEGRAALARIEKHVADGEIDPTVEIRSHDGHVGEPNVPSHRAARVGVYPVAADPFQWGHLLIGLKAIAEFKLDKVVFVLAGDDPRKPNMTKVAQRHPMGQAVLDTFAPLFAYSPIAVGTNYDGETNIFRMLALNTAHAIHAFYLVGGDHYKLKDAKGNDDTLPKLEKKIASPDAGHDPDNHQVSVAFIARGDEVPGSVPTTLPVHFLDSIPFEASSTQVRNGQLSLMPHAALKWVKENLPGHYGIAP